jgi:hypothetical protein
MGKDYTKFNGTVMKKYINRYQRAITSEEDVEEKRFTREERGHSLCTALRAVAIFRTVSNYRNMPPHPNRAN